MVKTDKTVYFAKCIFIAKLRINKHEIHGKRFHFNKKGVFDVEFAQKQTEWNRNQARRHKIRENEAMNGKTKN